jgi:hypothetical protein
MKRGTTEHPKFLDLCSQLSIPRYAATGVLEALWHFTAKFAPQGDVGRFSNSAIARALQWEHSSDELIQALVDCGWVDKHETHRLVIHDWEEHSDYTLKRSLSRKKLDFVQPKSNDGAPRRDNGAPDPTVAHHGATKSHTGVPEQPSGAQKPPHGAPVWTELADPPEPEPVPEPEPGPVPDPEPEQNLFAANAASGSPSKSWFNEKHETWYQDAYWNHTGKQDSRKAYEKIIGVLVKRGMSHDDAAKFLVLEAVNDRKRFELTEEWEWRARLHPATWLNGERWTDEPSTTAKPNRGTNTRLMFS